MFERLPGHDLKIPEVHYPSIPARPVIPTAALVAHLTQSLGETLKNLSPEERKKKEVELSIMLAKAREVNASAQLHELAAAKAKQGISSINDRNNAAAMHVNSSDNSPAPDINAPAPTGNTFEPAPLNQNVPDEADTHPVDYYGSDEEDAMFY